MGLINITNLEDDVVLTANMLNQRFGQISAVINGNIDSSNIANSGVTVSKLAADIFDRLWPVGTVYENMSVDTNPSVLLGFGTWVAIPGQFRVGYDAGQSEFNAVGATGGAKTHWHWQTVGSDPGGVYIEVQGAGSTRSRVITVDRSAIGVSGHAVNGSREDGTYDASSLPPYVVSYAWRRTA